MITLNSSILGPPDLTPGALADAILDYSSKAPAYAEAAIRNFSNNVVAASKEFGMRTSVVAGQMMHETAWLRFGGDVDPKQFNFAGLGATGGVGGAIFQSIGVGVRAVFTHHLAYVYGPTSRWPAPLVRWATLDARLPAVLASGSGGKVKVIGDYTNGRWAYSQGIPIGSLENGYAIGIVRAANDLLGYQEQHMASQVYLTAGHHNTQGGDAEEIVETGRMTPALADACRKAGMTVTVLTPDEGRGFSSMSLDDVAAQVPATAKIFLESHSEAGPRGVFVIYPDWGNDVDADVRDVLGPRIAKAVAAATGLPLRGNGTMSEKSTAVGAGGSRLGVFRVTDPAVTRMIIEFGSHTDLADLAIIRSNGFYERAAGAVAGVLADFLGVAVPSPAEKPIEPGTFTFSQTGHSIKGWFAEFFWAKGGVEIFGYPLTDEITEGSKVVQYFERWRMELVSGASSALDGGVVGGLIGRELLEAKGNG